MARCANHLRAGVDGYREEPPDVLLLLRRSRDRRFLERLVGLFRRDQRRQGDIRKAGGLCGHYGGGGRYIVRIVDDPPADVVGKVETPNLELATNRLGELPYAGPESRGLLLLEVPYSFRRDHRWPDSRY